LSPGTVNSPGFHRSETMAEHYNPLPFYPLEAGASYMRPRQELPQGVTEDSPAVDVMTDLSKVTAYTVELITPLDKALEIMVKRGVRLLLVRDADAAVRGLITSRDIQGEKPEKILQKSYLTREELLVRDIMTLKHRLEVLRMEDVLRARVGDLISTLKACGRQHAMVVDIDPGTTRQAVRGLFSLSQIGIQMGLQIDPAKAPTTAEELEQALARMRDGD